MPDVEKDAMKYVVKSAFNTMSQRMRAGAIVSSFDDLAPHTVASLVDAKMIESEKKPLKKDD